MPKGEEFAINAAVAGGQFIFTDGGLLDNLKNGKKKTLDAAWITAQRCAPEVENFMKTEAPWNDQTGNARAGLTARAFREGDTVGIVLAHSVFYGIFLEARWSGRLAIIEPTIQQMGPVVMRRFERLLDRY